MQKFNFTKKSETSPKKAVLQKFHNMLQIAVISIAFFSYPLAANAAENDKIGNCTVTGKFGEYAIAPAIAGQLTVQTELPHPGLWNGDTPDTIKDGFEYCLVAQIAHQVGLNKIEIIPVSFSSIIAGVNKNYDIALSAVTITDERKQVIDFSKPYFRSDTGLLVRSGSKIKDTAELKTLRVGVLEGTTGLYLATEILHIPEVKVFASTSEMIASLQAKQVDVVMEDVALILSFAAKSDGKFNVVGRYDTGEYYGMVFPKASKNAFVFNKIIEEMLNQGITKKLAIDYLAPVDIDTIPLFNE